MISCRVPLVFAAVAAAMAFASPASAQANSRSTDVFGMQATDPLLHGGEFLRGPNNEALRYRKKMREIREEALAAIERNGGTLAEADRAMLQAKIDAVEGRYRDSLAGNNRPRRPGSGNSYSIAF